MTEWYKIGGLALVGVFLMWTEQFDRPLARVEHQAAPGIEGFVPDPLPFPLDKKKQRGVLPNPNEGPDPDAVPHPPSDDDDDGYDGSGVWFNAEKAAKEKAKRAAEKLKPVPEDYKNSGFDRGHINFHAKDPYGIAYVVADIHNDAITVKYEKAWEKRNQPQEDFPRFHFEPIVGDFVLSDAGEEYQIVKRRYGWTGKPHISGVTLTIWLNRCRSVGPGE